MVPEQTILLDEFVMRMQPSKVMCIKDDRLTTLAEASKLDLSYSTRYSDASLVDTSTRHILDVLRVV